MGVKESKGEKGDTTWFESEWRHRHKHQSDMVRKLIFYRWGHGSKQVTIGTWFERSICPKGILNHFSICPMEFFLCLGSTPSIPTGLILWPDLTQ